MPLSGRGEDLWNCHVLGGLHFDCYTHLQWLRDVLVSDEPVRSQRLLQWRQL